MTIISVLNLKGGCAKTSTIVNLGGCIMAEKNKRPLLIDLDPQQSATMWARQGDKFPFPVIPLTIKSAAKIKAEIEKLAKEHKANVILIDTPPSFEDASLISALISELILIPITASPLDIFASEKAITTIRQAREERGGVFPRLLSFHPVLISDQV